MRKKMIAIILITAMALGVLTACSGEKPSILTDIELEVYEPDGEEMQ